MQTFFLLVEGILVLVFVRTTNLVASICVLVLFSISVQAAEGSSYGIVPYINPQYTGSVSGIVGAGGNVGAVCFGLCFRNLPDYRTAFTIMGTAVITSSILSALIFIKGQTGLLCGKKRFMRTFQRRKNKRKAAQRLEMNDLGV